MITNRMRRILEDDLDYLPAEIDVMDPQIASVVIERGLSRPSNGMPKKWIKLQSKTPSFGKFFDQFKKFVSQATEFVHKTFLPVFFPIAAILYGLNFLSKSFSKEKTSKFSPSKGIKLPSFFSNNRSKSSNFSSKPPNRSTAKAPVSRKNVDIKSLNKIVQSSSFL